MTAKIRALRILAEYLGLLEPLQSFCLVLKTHRYEGGVHVFSHGGADFRVDLVLDSVVE